MSLKFFSSALIFFSNGQEQGKDRIVGSTEGKTCPPAVLTENLFQHLNCLLDEAPVVLDLRRFLSLQC